MNCIFRLLILRFVTNHQLIVKEEKKKRKKEGLCLIFPLRPKEVMLPPTVTLLDPPWNPHPIHRRCVNFPAIFFLSQIHSHSFTRFLFQSHPPFISLCCAAALHSWRRLQRGTCKHPRDPPSDRIPNPHRLLSLLLLLRSPSLLDDRLAEPRYSSTPTPTLRLRPHSSKIRQ